MSPFNRSPYPQTSAACCPIKAPPSGRLPPVQKRLSSPFREVINPHGVRGLFTHTQLLYFQYKIREVCKVLLVMWYQIWPVYSWLEWLRSSSGFSWNSCRRCRQPLWESTCCCYHHYYYYFLLLCISNPLHFRGSNTKTNWSKKHEHNGRVDVTG